MKEITRESLGCLEFDEQKLYVLESKEEEFSCLCKGEKFYHFSCLDAPAYEGWSRIGTGDHVEVKGLLEIFCATELFRVYEFENFAEFVKFLQERKKKK